MKNAHQKPNGRPKKKKSEKYDIPVVVYVNKKIKRELNKKFSADSTYIRNLIVDDLLSMASE